MTTLLWVIDWYNIDNINGIIVELHGLAAEMILLVFIVEWINKAEKINRDKKRNTFPLLLILDYACNAHNQLTTNESNEKKYNVYFGDNKIQVSIKKPVNDTVNKTSELTKYINNDKDIFNILRRFF